MVGVGEGEVLEKRLEGRGGVCGHCGGGGGGRWGRAMLEGWSRGVARALDATGVHESSLGLWQCGRYSEIEVFTSVGGRSDRIPEEQIDRYRRM